MPVSVDDVVNLLCSVANKEGLVVFQKGQWRAVLYPGVYGLIGNILAGPPGIAVGAVLGAVIGSWKLRNKTKPVSQVLKGLRGAQKQKLFSKVKDIICNLDSMDDKQLTERVMGSKDLRRQLVDMLKDFFLEELQVTSDMQE